MVILWLRQAPRGSDHNLYNITIAKLVEYLLKGLKLSIYSINLLELAVNDAIPVDDSGLSEIKASRNLCKLHFICLAVLKALLITIKQARAI